MELIFSKIETQSTPAEYVQVVSKQEYGVPDYATKYLRPLLQKLYLELIKL